MAGVKVKICGIRDEEALKAAVTAGADFIGLVFHPPSPRHVSLELAAALAERARGHVAVVALVVDADDVQLAEIARAVEPDYIQCHGRETPARVARIAEMTGRPVIKAFRVRTAVDVAAARAYQSHVAFPLFDAWVPTERSGGLPGGSGHAFDWSLLAGFGQPFMLAGGLTPENVAEAIRVTGAPMVDVSSGVERVRGVKDPARIAAFVAAIRRQETDGKR